MQNWTIIIYLLQENTCLESHLGSICGFNAAFGKGEG